MRRPRGITLPELLAVLAVIGLLATVALPAAADMLARWRLERASEALADTLTRARAGALFGNAPTTILPTARDGTDWGAGWIVRNDRTGRTLTSGEPLDPRLVTVSSHGRTGIRFHANGTADGSNIAIVLCIRGRPATARAVVVSGAGRIRREPRSGATATLCAAHARGNRQET